jgi:hypothetical protein
MIVQKDVDVVVDEAEETIQFWEIPSVGDTVLLYNQEYLVKKVLHKALYTYADPFTPVKIFLEKV